MIPPSLRDMNRETPPPPADSDPAPPADPLALATLAARFLPPIDLPPRWERMDAATLEAHLRRIRKASTPDPTAFAGGEPDGREADFRTPWQLLCAEAVSRAADLLAIAGGADANALARARAAQLANAATEAATGPALEELLAKINETADDLFRKLAKRKDSIPRRKALRALTGGHSREPTLRQYDRLYLELRGKWKSTRHHNTLLAGQVEFEEFRDMHRVFSEFLSEWRFEVHRAGSARGGRKTLGVGSRAGTRRGRC